MASLRSRNKAAGLQAGFFGQLNANTARRKTLADNMARMQKKQELELAKSDYEREVTAKEAKETRRLTAVAAGQTSGGFETQAAIELGDSIRNLNPKAKRIAITNKALQLKTLATEGRGNALVTGVEDDISVSTAQARNPEPPLPQSLPQSPDVQSPATREPAIQDIQGSAFDPLAKPIGDFTQASGKFLDSNNNPVSPAFDKESGRPFIISANGEKDFNVKAVGNKRSVIRQVNLRAENGKILFKEEFTETLNPVTGNPEIFKDGKYIPSPANTVTTKKTEAQGNLAKQLREDFSDKDNERLAHTETAVNIIDNFLETATLESRGPRHAFLRTANWVDELVISTGLKEGGDINLAEIIARHKTTADLYGDEYQLSIEEEAAVYRVLKREPEARQKASFVQGEMDAMAKILPMIIVRAVGGGGRISTQLVQTVASVASGKPSTHAAASLNELKGMMNESRQNTYKSYYAQDRTPQDFIDEGWTYGGATELNEETGMFKYSMVHPEDRIQIMLEVRTNPTVELLRRKRASILRGRRSK